MKPYIFDLERSANGLRLNRFLHSFAEPAARARFADDPEQAMQAAGLDEQERNMIRGRDWRAMMDHGASFFCLEKLARAIGTSNPEMVAAFRGETLEEFLKTRRVPGAR
jgi:gallate dioxygenase